MREAVLLTKIIQEKEMRNHSAHVHHGFISKKQTDASPYGVEDGGRSRFAEPRECERKSARPTAALLRSLQWVSDRYVSPRDTALTDNLLW